MIGQAAAEAFFQIATSLRKAGHHLQWVFATGCFLRQANPDNMQTAGLPKREQVSAATEAGSEVINILLGGIRPGSLHHALANARASDLV